MACTAAYRPYKSGQGYVVLPVGENQFRIEYYSNNPAAAANNWQLSANQVCPSGFNLVYEDKYTIHGTVRTPVAGQMVDLGSQNFIHYGLISCKDMPSISIELSEANWFSFSNHTKNIEPVSDIYIARTLNINRANLINLTKLPALGASVYLTEFWRKPPTQQIKTDANLMSVWPLESNSRISNSVLLVEKRDCLVSLDILPSNLMVSIFTKIQKIEFGNLIKAGIIQAYTFKSPVCL